MKRLAFIALLLSFHYMQGQENIVHDTLVQDTLSHVIAAPAFIYAAAIQNPLTVSSLTSNDISGNIQPTIEPLLNQLPGIWMQTATLSTNRISIRGVGYREPFATTGIKMYLDDIPLTNGAGESSIEDIPPSLLSGIDVWRGPTSALWGSGLGGMIHFKSAFPTQGTRTSITAGSFGRFEFNQALAFGNKTKTNITYQYITDDGYRENNQYDKHAVSWQQQWLNTPAMSLSTFGLWIDLKSFIPSSINLEQFKSRPESAAPTWLAIKANEDYNKWIAGIQLLNTVSSNVVYKSSVFASNFSSNEVRPFGILDESSLILGTRHRLSYQLSAHTHITGGIEFYHERYKFSTYEPWDVGQTAVLDRYFENRTSFNGFLQAEATVAEDLTAFAGLHLASNYLKGDQLQQTEPVRIYPTAGFNYLFTKTLSASFTISRGYSNYSLDDLIDSEGSVVEQLIPESGWNKEVNITIGNPGADFFKAGYYHMTIDNSILTLVTDAGFTKYNGGASLHQGIETEYLISTSNKKLEWKGSYTFQSAANRATNAKLPGIPQHRSYNRIAYQAGPFLIYASHQFVSEVYLNDGLTAKAEAYQVMHTGLEYKFIFASAWRLKLTGQVQNVLDEKYASMYQVNAATTTPRYYYPGKPRSVYFGIVVERSW